MTSKVLLPFVLCLSIVIAAIGQQPSPTPPTSKTESDQKPTTPDVDTQDVVKITTNLVQIDAVVTKDGKAVTDLQPSDFEIFEDNKPQAITNVSFISNQGQPAQLYARIRLVRDGKIVFSGEPTPVTINGQAHPQRLTNVMKLQIGSDLIPGDYVCQIIVTDGADNNKPRVASQWIDFEIVK